MKAFFFFWHALSFRYLKKQRFQMQQESSSFTLSRWVWMLHSKYESTKFHKTLGNLRQSNTLFLITEERLNKWRNISHSWAEKPIFILLISPQIESQIQNSSRFLYQLTNLILKCTWKHRSAEQLIFKKQNLKTYTIWFQNLL